jgi:hypothetical protein
MDKKWLIPAAILSALSLAACDDSSPGAKTGSGSSGSSSVDRTSPASPPPSSGSSTAPSTRPPSPPPGAGGDTAPGGTNR